MTILSDCYCPLETYEFGGHMPDYSMDHDPEFWQAPARFETLRHQTKFVGLRTSIFCLGDPQDERTPACIVLEMEPGYVITRHAHPCERFEAVVRGSIDVGDRILYPGDVMTAHANEFYGPKVAGPDGCTTIETFATLTGVYERIVEDGDGSPIVTNLIDDFDALLRARDAFRNA